VLRSFICLGFYDSMTPSVVRRNLFEHPGWYTQYTPYQSEFALGRLVWLLYFQTLVSDLTGMEVANASMLDAVGAASLEALIDEANPASIRLDAPLDLPAAESESQ
jgi:glycine dehydrogenase